MHSELKTLRKHDLCAVKNQNIIMQIFPTALFQWPYRDKLIVKTDELKYTNCRKVFTNFPTVVFLCSYWYNLLHHD